MIRNLKRALNDALEQDLDKNSTPKFVLNIRELIKNADKDMETGKYNQLARSYGYAEVNKYSWQKRIDELDLKK